jgi:O-antigen ligase
MRAGRWLTELGLLAYLAQFPFGAVLAKAYQAPALAAMLAGLLIVHAGALQRGQPGISFGLVWPTLAFFFSFGLSILASDHVALSAGRARFLPVGLLFFFVVQQTMGSLASLRRLSWVWLAVLFGLGLQGVYHASAGVSLIADQQLYAGRIRSGLPHPNDTAIVSIVLPLAAWGVAQSQRRLVWALGGCALALGVATVVLSASRNALIGLGVVVMVSVVLSRHRRTWMGLGAAVLAGMVVMAWVDPQSVLHRFVDPGLLQREGRVGLWLSAFEIFRAHPLTGSGPFLFDRLYAAYLDPSTLPIGYQPEQGYLPWVHNLYLEALAERGAIGLGSFLVLITASLRRVSRGWRDSVSAAERSQAVALAAAWAAFLVMALLDMTFLKDWVLVIFMLLVGLAAVLPARADSVLAASGTALGGSSPSSARECLSEKEETHDGA